MGDGLSARHRPDAPTTVHPTPIYETLAMGLVAWVLWRCATACGPGVPVRAATSSLAGLERFLVEFLRRNADVVAGLTAPQLESLDR